MVEANVPAARVLVDGQPVGPSGATPYIVMVGERTVRLEKEGYKPFETRITLAVGEKETVQARLVVKIPPPGQTFRDKLKDGSLGPKMVVIPAGEFLMGSPEGEKGRNADEGPQRRVRIAKFALGVTEVTFAEYDRFVLATRGATGRELPDDAGWGRGRHPMIDVSWKNATDYAEWLSRETGQDYRLPTEAEWEYAARAGTTTRYFWGDDDASACTYANGYNVSGKNVHDFRWGSLSCDDGHANTAPVGSFRPNGFGLFDMSGNVYEWSCSLYKGSYDGFDQRCTSNRADGSRVLRGGSWFNGPRQLRSANRFRGLPDSVGDIVGFRLARDF
ncbi:MAG: Formylglycine-generating enzyme, required for sulfatase activity, contains SUMF1/FGE domain [Candidatus Kentron sp. G]|nr:MAG: Formylglycine-generating enzyme, required for sulfatase activity, contains SUMF1/FGE domain [Candidatus Kentron sp. G]VFM98726.1 MAG: Formylglycine-generating enzyme, required for sulfatase activity, contains SUMF1/FGE domain [Candidatus Kentron sp. G]VFM99208.1 MAG: Formylglycine-generating enzyme, required for sulfatase activity, contains SUMF1/FGE domain [Candidatus Kentron sp. G]